MKFLISCDDYCYQYKDSYYLREYGDILVHRYLRQAEKLRLVVRVKIVSKQSDLGPYKIPLDSRIEIWPMPFFQGGVQFIKSYPKILSLLNNVTKGCDACIVRLPSVLAFEVLNFVVKSKIPYGVEVVANPYEQSALGNIFNRLIWRYLHYRLKRACLHANCISYVTKNSLQQLYPSTKPNHFVTNYSSVELPLNNYKGPRTSVHPKFVICHISNPIMRYNKGHETLLRVVSQLINRGCDISVKIAGDGPYVPYFKEMAKQLGILNHVEFLGFINGDQVTKLLESSDLMLFPTLSEGLPRVIIEAMTSGLPCLSTPVGGIPELLSDDCLFDPMDVDAFADKAYQLIQNNSLYSKISEFNYKKSLEYSSPILTEKRDQMYKELIKRV